MPLASYGHITELGAVNSPPLSFDKFSAGGGAAGATTAEAAAIAANTAANALDSAHRSDTTLHLPASAQNPISGDGQTPFGLDISGDAGNTLSLRADGVYGEPLPVEVEDESGTTIAGQPTFTVIEPTDGSALSLVITSPSGKTLTLS